MPIDLTPAPSLDMLQRLLAGYGQTMQVPGQGMMPGMAQPPMGGMARPGMGGRGMGQGRMAGQARPGLRTDQFQQALMGAGGVGAPPVGGQTQAGLYPSLAQQWEYLAKGMLNRLERTGKRPNGLDYILSMAETASKTPGMDAPMTEAVGPLFQGPYAQVPMGHGFSPSKTKRVTIPPRPGPRAPSGAPLSAGGRQPRTPTRTTPSAAVRGTLPEEEEAASRSETYAVGQVIPYDTGSGNTVHFEVVGIDQDGEPLLVPYMR